MRLRVLAIAFALALSATVYGWTYLGYEAVTVGTTAVGFTANCIQVGTGCNNSVQHDQATAASCRLETAEIRFRYDGPAATNSASGGTLLEVGETLTLSGNDALQDFSAIRTGSSSGVLQCTYADP